MRDGERRHDRNQGPQPSQRNDEAEQKQEMIRSAENVEEAMLDERERRLTPARIQTHEPGIARQFERANHSARRQKSQDRHNAEAEARKRRMDRKGGAVGFDRVFEQHVEQAL